MIRKYIDGIMKSGDTKKEEHLKEIFIDLIYSLKEHYHDKYEYYESCLYELANGKVINDDLRDKILIKIGCHWNIEETEKVRLQYNYTDILPNDFSVVMNMAYSDYKDVFGDNLDMYARFSRNFIKDEDAKEGKVYLYFRNIVN